jgi:hypothetical protein
MTGTVRPLLAAMLIMLLAACGGGGSAGSSSSSSGTTSTSSSSTSSGGTVTLTNFTTVTVDAGPAALNTGTGAYTATNVPYVSVTVCAPGSTTNCQTIDHVLLDTGSVGLRLEASVLNSTLLSALTSQTDTSGNAVGECYEFVDDYVFGSVRVGDFSIGGESVSSMPMQIIGDTSLGGGSVPRTCSSSGGVNMSTVQLLGANGIIGVSITTTDCGTTCTSTKGTGGAIYYDCPSTGCSSVVARAANTSAPFQQLPNPVAAFGTDNNGTILSLPSVAATGAVSVTGTLYFGIGTQTNNALGSASVLPTDASGYVSATYNGAALPYSFLDSGSNYYYFVDNSIATCGSGDYSGFYCPSSALSLTPTLAGSSGTVSAAFTLYNAQTEPASTSNAAPGIGANPNSLGFSSPISNSFDFGLPFFYGRNVYTAISGRTAGSTKGPYFAF